MKIKLTKDIEGVITECYKSDKSLLVKHHILAPTTLDEAICHTVSSLSEVGVSVYKLTEHGKFCGYFATEKTDVLFIKGFFLMPFYRTKKHKEEFIQAMNSVVNPLIIPIYDKNKRGNRFLLENKFKFVKQLSQEDKLVNVYILET